MFKFNYDYAFISGSIVDFKIIDYYQGDGVQLPFYWYTILLKNSCTSVGKISLRVGYNYHSYYNGNIGYEVDEKYRGNHYAYYALLMLRNLALYHGMHKFILTCDENNAASYKTIERTGAKLIEITLPPKDYFAYYDGIKKHRIYELTF